MGGPHTLARLADWAADAHGDAEALSFRGNRWTFRTLRDEADRAARALMAQGLRPGESVGIWASNSDRWVIAALGTLAAGGVLVPVNTRYRAAESADILRRARARVLLTEHDFLGRDYRAEIEDGHELPALERVVALHDDGEWAAFLASGDAVTSRARAERSAAIAPDAPSDLLFTSGTTGRPKGVIGEHGQVVRASQDWARSVTLQFGDRYLLVNPFFHTFGYKAGFVACLLKGAAVLPEPVFDAARVLERIERDRVSVLTGAPTVFLSLLNHPRRSAHDLSSLRMAGTGASNIPTRIIEQIRELGAHTVFTAYGLTESNGFATICSPHEDAHTLAHTAGPAMPGTEIRIDASAGRFADGEGEVLIRGYQVMRGYLDDPDATAAALDADGWLRTGDVGRLDERGFLTITDRLKDMFLVGGFNAYPAEIEQALRGHPALADVAVVGAPDERLGEVGVAYCVAADGAGIDGSELAGWARQRLANFKVPRAFVPVDALPHNAAGKVDKVTLRERARRERPSRT